MFCVRGGRGVLLLHINGNIAATWKVSKSELVQLLLPSLALMHYSSGPNLRVAQWYCLDK